MTPQLIDPIQAQWDAQELRASGERVREALRQVEASHARLRQLMTKYAPLVQSDVNGDIYTGCLGE